MKYSKETTEEICGYIEKGNTQKDAAILAGIAEDTFYEWMKKEEFSEPIKKALSKCKNRNIQIIQKAAIKTWQAAAWWLERRFKGEYSLRTEHTGKDGTPIVPIEYKEVDENTAKRDTSNEAG